MIDSIVELAMSYQFVSFIALYTYWVPFMVCTIVYVMRCASYYRADLKASSGKYYTPKLTVGYIVWHIIIATLPAINIFAMVFDCASSVFRWLGNIMDIPLVRKKPESTEAS